MRMICVVIIPKSTMRRHAWTTLSPKGPRTLRAMPSYVNDLEISAASVSRNKQYALPAAERSSRVKPPPIPTSVNAHGRASVPAPIVHETRKSAVALELPCSPTTMSLITRCRRRKGLLSSSISASPTTVIDSAVMAVDVLLSAHLVIRKEVMGVQAELLAVGSLNFPEIHRTGTIRTYHAYVAIADKIDKNVLSPAQALKPAVARASTPNFTP